MTELESYVRTPRRNRCARCSKLGEQAQVIVDVDGWTLTARCHGAIEVRWLSLSYLEDHPRSELLWFAVKPEYELIRFGIDRHGMTRMPYPTVGGSDVETRAGTRLPAPDFGNS